MELFRADIKTAEKYIKTVGAECINFAGYLHEYPAATIYTDAQHCGLAVIHEGDVLIHTKTKEFVDAVMLLRGDANFFCNLENFVAEYILSAHKPLWQTHCHILHYPHKVAPEYEIPANVTVAPIDLNWLDLVNDNYAFRDEFSRERIKSEITLRPSSAVYVDGVPVCWNLLHDDYSMGAMFCLPEYRHCGYAYIAAADLIGKELKNGMTPYIQVIYDNYASLGLAKKLGFEKIFEAYWFEL